MADFAIDEYDEDKACTFAEIYNDIDMQPITSLDQLSVYPLYQPFLFEPSQPDLEPFEFESALSAPRQKSSSNKHPLLHVMEDHTKPAPQPRRQRAQTVAVENRTHANSTTAPKRQWHGPAHMERSASGYGPTASFPTMQPDQPSPPELKPDVKTKAVKHKRGYQACDQCRQRKTGCQLGGMQHRSIGNDVLLINSR